MSAATKLLLVSAIGIGCGALGICLGLLTKRAPKQGWIGLAGVALSAVSALGLIGGDEDRLWIGIVFLLIAPCATLYSIFTLKRAPDRKTALAGFVGGMLMGALFLFVMFGLVLGLIESLT